MRYRILTAGMLLLAFSAMTPAHADDRVPDDVKQFFATEALEDMYQNGEAVVIQGVDGEPGHAPVDYSDVTQFGLIGEMFVWSQEFLFQGVVDKPTQPINEWIAPALRENGEAVGTYSVRRPAPNAQVEPGSFDNDYELGTALKGVPEGAQLVMDPTIGGWYFVKDGRVTALNSQAAVEIPRPVTLEEFEPIVAQRYAEAIEASRGTPGSAGGGGSNAPWWYRNQVAISLLGGFAALAVAGLVFVFLRRGRESSG